jgi:hypothetical protein
MRKRVSLTVGALLSVLGLVQMAYVSLRMRCYRIFSCNLCCETNRSGRKDSYKCISYQSDSLSHPEAYIFIGMTELISGFKVDARDMRLPHGHVLVLHLPGWLLSGRR